MKLKKFPAEFEDLLNKNGKKILKGQYTSDNFGKKGGTPIEVVKGVIDDAIAADCVTILRENFHGRLKNISSPLDPNAIKSMKKNYSEKLAKTLKMQTLELGVKKTKTNQLAHDCGLMQMLASDSLKAFAEAVTGEKFGSPENNQIICYRHGDYVSPHNDHHPENDNVKHGYYDIHLMFSNEHVQHQWLVYEKKGFLNSTYDIASPSAIAIYRLPFWHYTTPMMAKENKEADAQRWLLLRSFEMPEKKRGK
jgi:hypothetical protein